MRKLDVNRPGYVLVFAAAASAAFTAAIMSLHAATESQVRRNERLFEQRALVEAFGLHDGKALTDQQVIERYDRHIRRDGKTIEDPQSGTRFEVIRTVEPTAGGGERLLGYAFPVWGTGFWARIDGWLAVTPDLSRAIGIVFVRHSETPGLGARITEPRWRKEFEGLNLSPPPAGEPTIVIGPGDEAQNRRVDAITGATGTCTAVERFLNLRIPQFRRAAVAAGLIDPL